VSNLKNKLILPTVLHTLDCFNTTTSTYSNGVSRFYLAPAPVDTLFIMGLYSFLYQNYNTYDDEVYIINPESLREFLGFSRGGKSKNIRWELARLQEVRCYIDNKEFPLAALSTEGRLLVVHSTYFHELSKAMRSFAQRPDGSMGSRYTSLIYADICKAKRKASAEVCIELCKLIERRGSIISSPVHIAVKTLVTRCPHLRQGLYDAPTNSRRNQVLRQSLSEGIQLIASHTTAYQEYRNLSIVPPDKPAFANLNEIIRMTHGGKIYESEGLEDE